jgi:hypothetical protein
VRYRVILNLEPDAVHVLRVADGRVQMSRTVALDGERDTASWLRALVRSASAVRKEVESMRLRTQDVCVLYRSPSHAVTFDHFELATAEACEAAQLECLDALASEAAAAHSRAIAVGSDTAGDAPVKRVHTVAAADLDEVAAAIVDFVEDVGLRAGSMVPIEALVASRLLRAGLRKKSELHGTLYIGEQNALFIVGGKGCIHYARRLRFGVDKLAAALTRPITIQDGAMVELTRQQARDIVARFGRPKRDEVVDEEHGLRGSHITPLIQPVLQRFLIELRQSLRFGLAADQREGLEILVTGPGNAIPDFVELLGGEVDVPLLSDEGHRVVNWDKPGGKGRELMDALARLGDIDELSLVPSRVERANDLRRIRRWLTIGAAAAMVAVAGDAARLHLRRTEVSAQAELLRSQIGEHRQLQQTGGRIAGLLSSMRDLDGRIDAATGLKTHCFPLLLELSRLTPKSVKLTRLTLDRDEDVAMGSLTGFARAGIDTVETDLNAFVKELRDSPLIARADLTYMETAATKQQQRQQSTTRGEDFEIRIATVLAPLPAVLVSAETEGGP